jgi:hypothetical protein
MSRDRRSWADRKAAMERTAGNAERVFQAEAEAGSRKLLDALLRMAARQQRRAT